MQRGLFVREDTQLMSEVLRLYALGLFPFTVYLFLNRAFYSLQDTKTPLALNFIGNAFNSLFNLAIVGTMGAAGLALGHATAYTLIALISLWLIGRRVRKINWKGLLPPLAKIAAASLATGMLALAAGRVWGRVAEGAGPGGGIGLLAAGLLALALSYLGLARLLGLSELEALGRMLKRKLFGA
jgi:putative peptidoglycan lipid II flippase